jgi:TolB-like protein/Tfp pilus assembly protein PilF
VVEQGQMLSSWKEIASYLGRTVRTCQRLEALGLPIHRLDGSPKAHVFAYPRELDAWLAKKIDERAQPPKRRRLRLFPAIVALGLIAGAVGAVIVLRPRPDVRSIAVLTHDLSPRRGSEHVSDGIAEAVRNTLMQVKGLYVAGRYSSEAVVKDRKLGYREIGRTLNVANILDLGVTVDGEELRVTADLISAKNGYQLWAADYNERLRDIFDIQDQIKVSIAEELKLVLLPGEASALGRHPTEDSVANDFYMKGRTILGRPWPGAPQEALRVFNQAVARDPKFALARVGIAWVYMTMISQFLARPAEAGPMAESAVKEALALDPNLAEAHALNGWVQFLYEYDWEAAEKSFRRALELKPGDGMIRGMYAYSLMSKRRFREARTGIKRALALDPFMPVLSADFMWIHLNSGRIREALEESERVRQFEPKFEFAYLGAGQAYLSLGRLAEAMEMYQQGMQLPRASGRCETGLLVCHLKSGDRQGAEALYADLLKEREKSGLVSPAYLAWAAVSLGKTDEGFQWLDTAVREHDPTIPLIQSFAEAVMPEIARDPRFLALLDKLNLPH